MLVPAIGKAVSSAVNAVRGQPAPRSALTSLPASSTFLWGLWPMDATTASAITDLGQVSTATYPNAAALPPNHLVLSGTTSVPASGGRFFTSGSWARITARVNGNGPGQQHPLNPVRWVGGGHAFTFTFHQRLHVPPDNRECVIVNCILASNQYNFFINIRHADKKVHWSQENQTETVLTHSFLWDIPPAKFDGALHAFTFIARDRIPGGGVTNAVLEAYVDDTRIGNVVRATLPDNIVPNGWASNDRTAFNTYANGTYTYTSEIRDMAIWSTPFSVGQVATISALNAQNIRLRTFLGL